MGVDLNSSSNNKSSYFFYGNNLQQIKHPSRKRDVGIDKVYKNKKSDEVVPIVLKRKRKNIMHATSKRISKAFKSLTTMPSASLSVASTLSSSSSAIYQTGNKSYKDAKYWSSTDMGKRGSTTSTLIESDYDLESVISNMSHDGELFFSEELVNDCDEPKLLLSLPTLMRQRGGKFNNNRPLRRNQSTWWKQQRMVR